MHKTFILTTIFIFLTIFVESISLMLQLKGRKLTRWLGKNAFNFHMSITLFFWVITFCLIVILQFGEHPMFHNNIIVKYIGLILLVSGLIVAIWALRLLGVKRALCLNFFEENVSVVKKSLYKYIDNPMDYGFWIALFGFAIFTKSIYNFIIAVEFIIIMIPHSMLENKPLRKSVLE